MAEEPAAIDGRADRGVSQPIQPGEGRDRQGDRRARRDRRRRADLPVRRRARAAGGRAGAGQDAAGPHAGRRPRPGLQPDPVHARPDAGRHHRHQHRDGGRPTASGSSSSSAGRSSRRSSWPTRSTAPRPRRSRPCSRRCRSTRSPVGGTIHRLPAAVLRAWRRRTRSSRKGPTRCPRPSSTGSSSSCSSATRRARS